MFSCDQERKLGDRRRSDTVVVSTINYADQGLEMNSHFCVTIELFQLHCVIENRLLQHLREKSSECMGFGGSMVARLKLKGIDGRAHQEWSLRLNLTQHGETYQGQIAGGLTAKNFYWELFLDLLGGGAWSFLVGGVNCLVNSDNERDLNLLTTGNRFFSRNPVIPS